MSTATTETRSASTTAKALGVILGIPVIIGLMLFAFLAPNFSSGPQDVPVALSAPEPVIEQITQGVKEKAGDDAPDIRVMNSPEEVRESILNRETVGGIAITPDGATAYTASGNGAPYVQLIDGIASSLEAQNMPVEREDLAPTTEDDPQAAGIALLGLPLAFGGIISAVVATFLFRGNKWVKLGVLVGIAALGALVATWMLHSVYGTLSGSFGMEWLAISLGILATSMLTAGLAAVIGTAGMGIGAVLTIFLANPLSGLSTGPWLLPAGWSTLGQWMPIGATGHLVRSLSFFDGSGAGAAWWVLAAWIATGFLLLLFDRSTKPASATA
ncbi:SNG1 family protein [Corynebacterium genitalium ATCC 33030]|uniref:ABC transporter permease n=1 Tax=Corynebacterium genitalium ATCC 33030 TaxID=585529 RepID=D7WAS9_9CORY|nr:MULTISPECIES: hypothetical protein [Corynebacterium]EFK54960.1 hypothetical protein HMPREF0291_10218 [Corynebacterium genitalium ATCC 33030]MCQ4617672.1 ABC transporter permease [Corynebacterium pseudogenitalium]MCQ4620949.1 ABC transporter permease [Corynebacterium sp. CCUG 71335]UUA89756.1 SNG1 family protein [Corynebacterium genitalium ATCC 33030]